jgi:nicotinamide-nucleotide amidase
MNAEIITIGEELLIGQVINTNAAWMGEQLNEAGISVSQITSIPDHRDDILRLLAESGKRSQLILITGGLGPTRDDVTKDVLCEFFGTSLVLNETVLEDIRGFFQRKGLELTHRNQQQAMVPASALVLRNPHGTAPGLWLEKSGSIYVAMPGVPYEMKHIMNQEVLPRMTEYNGNQHIIHKTILTQGIGESFLSDLIAPWEQNLPAGIQLAYLPSPGTVRIRLTGKGHDLQQVREMVDAEARKLELLIPQYIWGFDKDTLEEATGRLLKERGNTVGTAESCTGGHIAHRITSVPGSSAWFRGSIVAYSNEIKEKLLEVQPTILEQHGAVSREVVEAMATNALKVLGTDFSIAVSGIAGPDGGTAEKPVGTVWIAVACKGTVESRKFQFGDSRDRNILRSTLAALSMLRSFILKQHTQ